MKPIPRKIHAIIDYLFALILGALPWIMNYSDVEIARNVSVITAAAIVLISLMTDYELGVFRTISYSTHLAIDVVTGIFLVAAPWIFNFDDIVYSPFVMMGIAGLLVVSLSTDKFFRVKGIGAEDKGDLRKHKTA
jgi:hypothetical protein